MSTQTMAVLPNEQELAEIVDQVWSSFLHEELVPVDAPAGKAQNDHDRLVASVSITGDWTGHLQVTVSSAGARAIAAGMFELDIAEVEVAEIADALGEIANMVGGSVKGMVGVSSMLSLPQVVLDATALISLDARELVTMHARWKGELLEVSLWERQAHTTGGKK